MIKFFLFLFFIIYVVSQKPFPTLPTDFTVVVERTTPSRNSTQTLVEFWDLTNDRAKIEYYNNSDVSSTLIFPSSVIFFF